MDLHYRRAEKSDAERLVELYNQAFEADYLRYGECNAYGRSREQMEESIERYPKEIIVLGDEPVGVISAQAQGNGAYFVGCLCVIPAYQGRGIGTQAMRHLEDSLPDWTRIELCTPADKAENVAFYTKKCGFRAGDTHLDGHVTLVQLTKERTKETRR